MTKEEILFDGLEYYTQNPEKRRCIKKGMCNYSPKSLNLTESEGCWIGRLLDPELAYKLDIELGETTVSTLVKIPEYNIPNWMRNKELTQFLQDCQNLHDVDRYWATDGLTTEGSERVIKLCEKHNINKKLVKKYL